MSSSQSGRLRALAAAAALLVGCEAASRSQACEPVSGQGCRDDQSCTLDEAGDPACQRPGTAQHFEPCTSSIQCARGFACLEVDGAPRCARMCALDTAAGSATCAAVAEGAQCLGVVAPQPSVGACVQTCVDPASATCPPLEDGLPAGCWVPEGVDAPVCAGVRGSVAPGDLCGVQARCARPTDLCVARDTGEAPRCWPTAAVGGQPCVAPDGLPGERVHVPGTTRFQVCVPARD